MGVYTEYLDRGMSFQNLCAERKAQLLRISALRGGRDVLVYAAALKKADAPISVGYDDLLPITDQLDVLGGAAVDVLLETPGGSGEAAEDIVKLLHGKYGHVAFIVPGWAKSAGTIIATAGNEILMGPASALGPIDAQIAWQGKVFSADALLEGLQKIKDEVNDSGTLNKAFIPILQGISPGELQEAQNTLDFAKALVRDWLARYKFDGWETHSSTGLPVTDEEKKTRADEIATCLCDHKRWLTHARSIKLGDLEAMGLKITDYSKEPDLMDAIQRYYTLLQMTFDGTTIYKVIETPSTQIYRFQGQVEAAQPVKQPGAEARTVILDMGCNKCGAKFKVQANLEKGVPIQEGCLPFPPSNRMKCPGCDVEHDLSDARSQIEMQTKKSVETDG